VTLDSRDEIDARGDAAAETLDALVRRVAARASDA
jgi:hypothetical protein